MVHLRELRNTWQVSLCTTGGPRKAASSMEKNASSESRLVFQNCAATLLLAARLAMISDADHIPAIQAKP